MEFTIISEVILSKTWLASKPTFLESVLLFAFGIKPAARDMDCFVEKEIFYTPQYAIKNGDCYLELHGEDYIVLSHNGASAHVRTLVSTKESKHRKGSGSCIVTSIMFSEGQTKR